MCWGAGGQFSHYYIVVSKSPMSYSVISRPCKTFETRINPHIFVQKRCTKSLIKRYLKNIFLRDFDMNTADFFRSRLDAMIDMRHPLVVLTETGA